MNPKREKGEPALSGTVLFYLNPAEAGRACQVAGEMGGKRYYLFNSHLWEIDSPDGRFYICGPAVGAPMAVLVLEKLVALGATRVIVCGTCGSLQADLAIGDVLLPGKAKSEEGVSAHYPLAGEALASKKILSLLKSFLEDISIPWQNGVVCSTDAPYRETLAEVAGYQKNGISGMDMEFSALLSVAAFRDIDLAAVMVVSDQALAGKWQSGFKDPLFKRHMKKVSRGLILWLGGSD
jgi:uridine phosphorylase